VEPPAGTRDDGDDDAGRAGLRADPALDCGSLYAMPERDQNGVTVYTTEPCGFCRQAKALLQARGVDYREVNLSKDPDGRANLAALTGQMTFPQIVVGRRSIGGFRELLEADRAGSLEDLLVA
jgi:glutaredoxin 3